MCLRCVRMAPPAICFQIKAIMPLDVKYDSRFAGYFHERQSHAPRFSTSSRFPRPHDEEKLPGPIATKLPAEKKSFCATFGSSRRDELWARKEVETRSKVAQLEGNGSVSVTPRRAVTPVRTRSHAIDTSNDMGTTHRSVVGPATFSQAKRYYDPIAKLEAEEIRLKPGPAAYDTQAQPGTFSLRERTAGMHDLSERHLLMQKFAREGTHTPRRFEASIMGHLGGGTIPRAGRKGSVFDPVDKSGTSPGPGAYTPQYGLRSR